MAKQQRKAAKGKPITSHQLFPAVVALWFGAAFGLGSLAVRPSLIEGLVLKSHIDLLIPAAAPPLGVTARILMALLMAALGAVIGLVIARRIARPRPVAHERKRSGRDLGREEPPAPRHYADATTHPESASVLAPRRRALAIEHEEEDFVPHDMAPLPGGNRQVFDISGVTIEDGPADSAQPLELGAFPEPAPPAQPINLDWSNAAPVAAPSAPIAAPAAIEAQRQVFSTEIAAPAPCPASQAAHADGRQVFGMTPPEPKPEAPRQIFGAAIEDDHVPQDFVKSAGFQTTVFEQEEAQPLFAPRAATPEAEPAPVAATAPQAPPIPQAFEPAPQPEITAAPVVAVEAPVEAPRAKPEPLPSPASLGMTDLAARLAESMRRRRAARTAPVAAEIAPAAEAPVSDAAPVLPVTAELPVEPVTPLAPVAVAPEPVAPAPIPAACEAPLEVAQAPFIPAVAPTAAPIPVAYEATQPVVAAGLPVVPEVPAALAALANPQAFAPVAEPEPMAPALPRAMQPLALDAFIEEDMAADPSLLPPRHIAMPAMPPVAAPVSAPAPEPVAAPAAAVQVLEEEAIEDVASDDSFGSLLGIAGNRNPFVRIEDPAPQTEAVEPVVIFPGQAPAQPIPFGAAPDATPFRRFDAPAAAGQAQPVAANMAPPAVEAGEADQALRAALANLQRMSGAA